MMFVRWKRCRTALLRAAGLLAMGVIAGCALPTDASDRRPSAVVVVSDGPLAVSSLGHVVQLDVRVLDQRGMEMRSVPLLWTVEDPDILEPVEGGRFRSLGNGRTIVRARVDPAHPAIARSGYHAGVVEATLEVVVEQQAVALRVSPPSTTLWAIGQRGTLELELLDPAGTPVARELDVLWWSEDEAIATVDDAGRVTAAADGLARIHVSVGDLRGSVDLRVDARIPYSACATARELTGKRCASGSLLLWEP